MVHLALALILATPASVDSRFGVNAHLPSSVALDAASAANIGWVRYDFNWFQMEPTKGNYDWSAADAAVDGAVSRGLSVYATLAYTPQWASANASCTPGSGPDATRCETQVFANVADWTDFVTAVVNRYHDRVKVFGMWNEPNLGSFWQGSETDYVNDVLKPGSTAVHAACSDCQVGGPELSGLTKSSNWNGSNGICAFGQCIRNGWELDLGDVLDDAGASIDVVTQHFYNADAQAEAVGQLTDGEFFGTTMTHDSLRDVLATHGASGKPIWLTETGMTSTDTGGTTGQANFYTALLGALDQLALGTYAPAQNDPFAIQKVFLYDLQDGGNDTWGLLDASGNAKPAYTAVKDYIAANPTLATPTPTPGPSATPTATVTATPGPTPTATGTPGNGDNGGSRGGCDVGGDAAAPGALLALAAIALAPLRRRRKV